MLRQSLGVVDFDAINAGLEEDIAGFVTAAMRDTTVDVQEVFREQVRGAGLGERLAGAIRSSVYPSRSRTDSLEPTGWIYARPSRDGRGAAGIIDAYANGRMIVPRAGKRWLLIPSDDCPRKSNGAAFTYPEVVAKFGKLDWIPAGAKFATPSARRGAAFSVVTKRAVIRKSTQAWRRATPRELTGRTRNPRPVQTVIMFEAVRAVRKPKSVDLSVPQAVAEARFEANLSARWR